MQLNENIKFIRELSGKTQAQFAEIVGTNLSNLKTYETTDVRPKANVLAHIIDIAGITIEDLEEKKLTHKDLKWKATGGKVEKVIPRETADIEVQDEVAIYTQSTAVQASIFQLIENNRILSVSHQALAEANKILAEANLVLAHKVNSNETGKVLAPDYSGEIGKRQDYEVNEFSGKKEARKPAGGIVRKKHK